MEASSEKQPPRPSFPSSHSGFSQLRHRQGRRRPSGGPAEDVPQPSQRLRRSSTLSDTITDARQSLRTNTDDLFLPRADPRGPNRPPEEESVLQSAPLVLALLPAIGGIFFENGSVFLTDVSLLALAAVFLNWSFRLPWAWYQSARQAVYVNSHSGNKDYILDDIAETITPENEQHNEAPEPSQGAGDQHKSVARDSRLPPVDPRSLAARRQLERHERLALICCFVLPILGAGMLHTIRDQLSRPSEGLVSNYNLTIFLLAAEMRPAHHLLKLVQARTLHLQRVVALQDSSAGNTHSTKMTDLTRRLEELETHVESVSHIQNTQPEPISPKGKEKESDSPTTDIMREVRKLIQPDIEALTRAVRKHEKRSVLWSADTEARIESLEMRVREAFSVAEYTRRNSSSGTSYGPLLWVWSAAVLPLQFLWTIACLPVRTAAWCFGSRGNAVQAS